MGYCQSEEDCIRKEARKQSKYHAMAGVEELEGDEAIVLSLLVSSGVVPTTLALGICYCSEVLEQGFQTHFHRGPHHPCGCL